ncbi:MAG: ribonuclease Z [Candidatus Altiarchaeales archaeon]|nr:ribonuclease Z [Candidatus Altiarchaeales archaeon]MBD3416594.1 ribonuclease Z [Candidatus Altiarchaeales archaeon]
MEVTFLGTSGCIPTDKRGLSSIHLDYLGEHMLFDCGEGTQRQMRFAGLNFMNLNNIFITHLHADHFLGLGGMIQSMDFLERERPLNIYGPAGMKDAMEKLLTVGTFRLDHLTVDTHEVGAGEVYRGDRYAISAANTDHTRNSLAYCFTEDPHRKFNRQTAIDLGVPVGPLFTKLADGDPVEVNGKTIAPEQVLDPPIDGRKVVYTGDTRLCRAVVKLAEGADLLIHESMFSHADLEATEDAAHSTARQAAEVAKKAGVKKLYLTHISQRYPEPDALLEEAREVFPESYVAEDLLKVKIGKHW